MRAGRASRWAEGGRRPAAVAAVALVALLALTGCGGGGSGTEAVGSVPDARAGADFAAQGNQDQATGEGAASALLPADHYVIATAAREIRVDDVLLALPKLTAVARANGGYVSSEDSSTDPADPATMTALVVLRVPTPRLTDTLDQLGDLGEVLSRQENVQDVTQSVVDVDSRVASAKASVARIRALLSRAQSIGDVVRIESELAQREADLESLEAQQRSLHDQTDYATVTVTLTGTGTVAPSDPDTGFLVGLEKGWHALTDAAGWVLTVVGAALPFLVVLGVVGLPFVALWRRRRTPPAEPPAVSSDEREDVVV